jgi:hypothetical protein
MPTCTLYFRFISSLDLKTLSNPPILLRIFLIHPLPKLDQKKLIQASSKTYLWTPRTWFTITCKAWFCKTLCAPGTRSNSFRPRTQIPSTLLSLRCRRRWRTSLLVLYRTLSRALAWYITSLDRNIEFPVQLGGTFLCSSYTSDQILIILSRPKR